MNRPRARRNLRKSRAHSNTLPAPLAGTRGYGRPALGGLCGALRSGARFPVPGIRPAPRAVALLASGRRLLVSIGSVPRVSSERVARPVYELSGEYGERARFVKANVVKANAIASKHNVYSIPTIVVFHDDKIVK